MSRARDGSRCSRRTLTADEIKRINEINGSAPGVGAGESLRQFARGTESRFCSQ